MTQEYIPTDEEVRHDYWSLDYPEGGYDFDVDAYEKERAEDFDRWLAAHDAQIRAEALKLSDEEADVAADALEDADDESWYYDDKQQVIRDVLKAVASFRKERKQ